jgi:hypothetical protein
MPCSPRHVSKKSDEVRLDPSLWRRPGEFVDSVTRGDCLLRDRGRGLHVCAAPGSKGASYISLMVGLIGIGEHHMHIYAAIEVSF